MQGKRPEDADKVLDDAKSLEEAGAFAVVLECVPDDLAKKITETLSIPTIGIGAGPHCDGQILVMHDFLGLNPSAPSFVKRFAELGDAVRQAATAYADEVRAGSFPPARK